MVMLSAVNREDEGPNPSPTATEEDYINDEPDEDSMWKLIKAVRRERYRRKFVRGSNEA